jgi:hypothetical protein
MSNISTGKHVFLVHKQTTHGSCKLHHYKVYRPVYVKSDMFEKQRLANRRVRRCLRHSYYGNTSIVLKEGYDRSR